MMKLLYANISRLFKSGIFRLAEAFLIGYAVFVYATAARNLETNLVITNWNLYFYNGMFVMGAVMAVFAAFFIGVEYSDGTMRNKLIIGHKRKDIYLANVLVCYVAGILLFFSYTAVSAIAGSMIVGKQIFALHEPLWCFGYSLVIIFAYAAFFTMIAMLDTNKARAVLAEIVLVICFLILTTQIYGDLEQPELTSYFTMTQEGEYERMENVPNPKYISGPKRTLYEWIDNFLPADQVMYVADGESEFSVRVPLCLFTESIVLIGVGVYTFQKKDIN